ncbi:MAG TPA: dihydrodipicolinate synthase family protein [Burkholderiales bacterium]|nr:dihydrodipicolinate synthase family protein [Burkholderiales bacterium]
MNYRKSQAKEAAREQFRGLWAAITTPFTEDGALDEAGLRRNMRHFTDRLGVAGIFCTGTMGEFWALTKEERQRTVEIVVEEARGKCKVIAHTGHHSPDETVDLTRHAERAGADFAIVINPYYPAANEEMIYRWFEYVASRVEIGIWMFDTSYAGYGFSPQLTARIAGIQNICGIKCSRPLDHYAKVRRLCGAQIVMSHPAESEWLTLMRDHGARVHMSSAAPFILQTADWRPMHDYTELGLQGRFAEAAVVARQLDPLRVVHERWMRDPWVQHKIIPIAYLKAWSALMGFAAGPVRPPLLPLTAAEHQALKQDLTVSGLLARLPGAAARAA